MHDSITDREPVKNENTSKETENNHQHKTRSRRASPAVRLLIKIAVLAAVLFSAFMFVLGIHVQRGNGMYPFIMDGDVLILFKLEDYRVGDAVAYQNPVTGKTETARIVATNTSTVTVRDTGELIVDSFSPDERVFYATKPDADSDIEYPYTLSGGYFLLNDYRTEGKDSRTFGEIPRTGLLGKVVYVFRRRGI